MRYLFLLLISNILLADNSICTKNLESMPSLSSGRVKPLLVTAIENFKFITGKSKINDNPVIDFCQLSTKSMGAEFSWKVPMRIDHIKAKELINLKDGEVLWAEDALKQEEIIKAELMTLKINDAYKKDLNKLYGRIQNYKEIINGDAWKLPVNNNGKIDFLPLPNVLTKDKILSFGEVSADSFAKFFEQTKKEYEKIEGDAYLVELTYKKLNPFSWSMAIVLIAIALGVILKNQKFMFYTSFLVILIQAIGMAFRVYISGRAPITNMYETVMFSGFGALLIAQIITAFKKDKIYVLSGLAYNLLCLMMMTFAGDMLDESISPLVPVLRDNFWLSTHVTTIILSYAALALSWILANMVIFKQIKCNLSASDKTYYVNLIYTCLKFGVVLLAAGIILGGVWADYSWGRFWGWDPKETWSLIVLLVYMAILHGKYTNWINNQKFVPLVAAAFMSVMMAWFGVNYILASGLHSYGFSEGGAIFLGSFFLTQITILVVHQLKNISGIKKGAA